MSGWWWRQASVIGIVLGGVALVGCGGSEKTASVSGTVTLNGVPLAGAIVRFQRPGGSPSAGVTDASGRYVLTYTRSVRGAEVGSHRVSISTRSPGDPDADPPRPPVAEQVPAHYNSATQLTAEVNSRANQFDFTLEASGQVVQPTVIFDE